MRISADHAFHIGSQHLRGGMPCQDYALSGSDDHLAYGVISDGCSTGGETDIGARVVGRSTAMALRMSAPAAFETKCVDFNCAWIDLQAKSALALKREDMLATSGYVAYRDHLVATRIVGDGVIAAKSRHGVISMTRIDWADNRPVYRAYADDSYAGFIAAHGGDLGADRANSTLHLLPYDRDREPYVRSHPLGEMVTGFSHVFDPGSWDFIAVFSDGVTQVDGMDWRDVVSELLSFKSTEGDFVKRRMNRFLKDCQKHGKGPVDDISMACIHLDHEAA